MAIKKDLFYFKRGLLLVFKGKLSRLAKLPKFAFSREHCFKLRHILGALTREDFNPIFRGNIIISKVINAEAIK